jgi:hypothetical protein
MSGKKLLSGEMPCGGKFLFVTNAVSYLCCVFKRECLNKRARETSIERE